MAATAALVFAGNNRLRYLITGDEMGGTATIQCDGGATPDLITDSLPGPIKQMALVNTNGLGTIAAGVITQAQARAIFLSDPTGATIGNNKVPRGICRLTPRLPGATPFGVDANVDMAGAPTLEVVAPADATAYLDLEVANATGISQ